MKIVIITLLTFTSVIIFAQNTVTWEGGAPGKETNWDQPKNWSNNQVPDEFSNIIIKGNNSGHHAQPIIKESLEVASIEIQAGATLTIKENGVVLIDGTNTYSKGISIYGGNLINKGVIQLNNIEDIISIEYMKNSMTGNGLVLLDGTASSDKVLVQD